MSKDKKLNVPTAIIFDWDDTLVDNWESINSALNTTLNAMGKKSFSLSKTRNRVRKSMRESFPILFGKRWKEASDLFLNEIKILHCKGQHTLWLFPCGLARGAILNSA